MPIAEEDFLVHAASAQEYLSLQLSEADTRAYLIDPVLRILGYQTVADIRREVPVPATKEFLDYELRVDGRPLVIVEAKALRHPITDQHAAQCVQYASVLGVRWCLITNGLAWAVYDAHAHGPLADKRVTIARLDGDAGAAREAWAVLSLFSRESLSHAAPISRLLADRVVLDELSRGDSPAVSALRRAIKDRFSETVSSQAVLEALQRLFARPMGTPPLPASVLPSQPSAARPADGASPTSEPRRLPLRALVTAGLLPPDAVLDCTLLGVTYTARVRGGQLEVGGKLYPTPSAAASALHDGKAANGWVIWRFKGQLLAELRSKLPPGQADSLPG